MMMTGVAAIMVMAGKMCGGDEDRWRSSVEMEDGDGDERRATDVTKDLARSVFPAKKALRKILPLLAGELTRGISYLFLSTDISKWRG